MSIYVGLDIGGVSLKLAVVGNTADRSLLARCLQLDSSFFSPQVRSSAALDASSPVLSHYRRIRGNPTESAFELLNTLWECIPKPDVAGLRVTGSGAAMVASALGAHIENEFLATAKAVGAFYPQVRTVFEMGGEGAKFLRLEPAPDSQGLDITDYQSNGDCAAGTGSFIDQQASRLLYSVEEVGAAACAATCAARVAGRCSVFAKTDMIHAQPKGYTTEQILKSL